MSVLFEYEMYGEIAFDNLEQGSRGIMGKEASESMYSFKGIQFQSLS